MDEALPKQLRAKAMKPAHESVVICLGYMTEFYVVVTARLHSFVEWYMGTDDERRMFMLFVAEDLETFWS